MLKNYFKTAWRNIRSNKFYAAINILGLTMGLIVGLFILLWVQDEYSFDRYNRQAKNIYKIGLIGGTGPTQQVFSVVIAPVATYAKNEIPAVKNAVRIMNIGGNTPFKYKDKVFTETGVAFVDSSYFSMFDVNLIKGNRHNPFPDNQSVVINETTAKKYFGDEDPIGKAVLLGKDEPMQITGVMPDAPANASVSHNFLLPITRFNKLAYQDATVSYDGKTKLASMDNDWSNFSFATYLLLKQGADIGDLTKKLQAIHERNKPEDKPVPYVAQALTDVHLYKMDGTDGGISLVRTFSMVALLILIIACINYVNLSTARAMLRAKEVSMRKIIGAGKWQLITQFITETALLFGMATLLALFAMYLLLPFYNEFSGKQLSFSLASYQLWACIAIVLLFTLAATSIYPAMLLSSFEPLKALKGKIAGAMGSVAFRRVLVVVQFIASVALIIGTLVISRQMSYIQNKNLGYNKENVFAFSMRDSMRNHYEAMKADLLTQPGIKSVIRMGGDIVNNQMWTGDNDWEGKPENSNLLFHPLYADENTLSFFNIPLVSGRNFRGSGADSSHYIINETAAKAMGLKNPVGKALRLWTVKGTIIGVVKDFHFNSMRTKIEPLVFVYKPQNCWQIYVKTTGIGASKAVAAAQTQWKYYNGQIPFNYMFLDEAFDRLYKSEQRTSALFNLFAGVAIVLSCMGLLGLAAYTAQVKTREIGIRKVLGASVSGIVGLLTREFILLVLLSFGVATPLAWLAMNKWLQDFAYRITIGWQIFVMAGIAAILIAFATVCFQSVKAALANPVKSLRSE